MGVFYQVRKEGSGAKPARDQRVRYDGIEWLDDFDGDERDDFRGRVGRVSDLPGWLGEVFTDMRVGEVRRVILPSRLSVLKEAYIEFALVAIR